MLQCLQVATEGDAFTLAFHDPLDAVAWAITMQQARSLSSALSYVSLQDACMSADLCLQGMPNLSACIYMSSTWPHAGFIIGILGNQSV